MFASVRFRSTSCVPSNVIAGAVPSPETWKVRDVVRPCASVANCAVPVRLPVTSAEIIPAEKLPDASRATR